MLTKYKKIINRRIDTTNETYGLGGWNPNGGDTSKYLYYSGYNRVDNYTPTLTCSRDIDKFTVSNSIGNRKLTYPVGLLTADEMMYAGGIKGSNNTKFYLYTSQYWWGVSPSHYYNSYVVIFDLSSSGTLYNSIVNGTYGLRPVVSLIPTSVVTQGDGTATNPYVVE